jgi:amino acid permease
MFFMTGYLLGIVLLLTITFLTAYSVRLLHEINLDMWLNSPEKYKVKVNLSLGDMCMIVLGENGRFIYRIFSAISNIGACLAYIIFFEMYLSVIIQ